MSGTATVAQDVTVGSALAAARKRIAPGDARVLLSRVMQRDTAYLIAHDDEPLEARSVAVFAALVARRASGEPVAYLAGKREFFGLEFAVTPAVLIPRPETELLVELALGQIATDRPCRVLDLGTGSGCVALSIAAHRPLARMTAVDRSPGALAVARRNARALALDHVEFVPGDWFAAVAGRRFELVVANPPYVAAADDHLGQGDLVFEPRDALAGGADGLDDLRRIIAGAPAHLAENGWLLVEHGYDQGPACRVLMASAGLLDVSTRHDLAGIERVTRGRFDGASASR